MWSKPVLLNLARGSDDGVETRTELEIRCPAARAAKPALPNEIAVVEHDRDAHRLQHQTWTVWGGNVQA